MNPSDYLYAIIAITIIVLGGTAVMSRLMTVQPNVISEDQYSNFTNTYNKQIELQSTVENMSSSVQNIKADSGFLGILNGLYNGVINGFKSLFTGLNFMNSVFVALSAQFGLPTWAGSLVILFVTVGLVFALWGVIFNRQF